MGFLRNLFRHKKNVNALPDIVKYELGDITNEITLGNETKNISNDVFLNVHEDIIDLLWIADGKYRNYIFDSKSNFYESNGIRITFSSFSAEEPSLIYSELPIGVVDSIDNIPTPSYYPSYKELSDDQRGVYWKLLNNPYSEKFNIGYVFILYYGLERHLLEGNVDKAFKVILKLRDIHTNSSFQNYSARALILTCLVRKRLDLIIEFYNSLDKEYKLNFSDNLNLLCKKSLGIFLTAKDIMKMAKTFEFTNQNYIKKHPDLFKEKLESLMIEKLYVKGIDINKYITDSAYKKLHTEKIYMFANMSINDTSIDIPLIYDNFRFKKLIFELLEESHEIVKKELGQMRKSGNILEPKKKSNKDKINILFFDEIKERELLDEYKLATDVMQEHFALLPIANFYYKYRDIDNKYLELCIEYCNTDISMLNDLQAFYILDRKKSIMRFSDIYSEQELSKKLLDITYFKGDIPAFKRLAIIYTKRKDYKKAIDICSNAINYYSKYEMKNRVEEFEKRKDKLQSKINI